MMNNIVISGIREQRGEDYEKTERLVKSFLANELQMPPEDARQIDFQRAHRFGKKSDNKPRPIVARLTHFKMKDLILRCGRNLKGTSLSVNEQYPPEIMDKRRALYPVFKQAREAGATARLVMGRLYINGWLYRTEEEQALDDMQTA